MHRYTVRKTNTKTKTNIDFQFIPLLWYPEPVISSTGFRGHTSPMSLKLLSLSKLGEGDFLSIQLAAVAMFLLC